MEELHRCVVHVGLGRRREFDRPRAMFLYPREPPREISIGYGIGLSSVH